LRFIVMQLRRIVGVRYQPRHARLVSLVTVAALSASMASAVSLVSTSSAQAEGYYWGCTYSWGNVCFGPNQGSHELLTMDQNDAYNIMQSRYTNNGYPRPSNGHPDKDVCGGVWSDAENRQAVGWVCGWYAVSQSYPGLVGQPLIGTAVEYYGISLYQVTDEL
jgi:hypothetical protein